MPDILDSNRIYVRSKQVERACRVTEDNLAAFTLAYGPYLPNVLEFVGWTNKMVDGGREARLGDYYIQQLYDNQSTYCFIDEVSFDRMYEEVVPPETVVINAPILGAKLK